MSYTILRYPNVYGPRQNPHGEAGVNAIFIVKMLSGQQPIIYGDGLCMRDYLFVLDLVEVNDICLMQGQGQIYNLGTGIGITVKEVFETIRDLLNVGIDPIYKELRQGEVWKIYLKSDKITKELNWQAKTDYKDGIKLTIEWYKKSRES